MIAKPTDALIVGAGIGGLAAALALRQAGLSVRVTEQAERLEEVGAGLQLSPNATRILRTMGLLPALQETAVAPEALEVRDGRSGNIIAECPYAPAVERYGAPFLVVHRADLHRVLSDAAHAAGCEILLGTRVEGVEAGAGAAAAVASREGEPLLLKADFLVGADGVRSAVRTQLGFSATPVFADRVAYRATIPTLPSPHPVVRLFLGADAHLVTYPVRGGASTNVVAVVKATTPVTRWSEPGETATVHAAFSGWAAEVRDLLARAESYQCWGLFDLEPLPRWGTGRATLIGDAAHAMLPFLAQGAAQAIEDAAALASAIGETLSREDALRAYESTRRPRAARIQREARGNGFIYHLAGPARMARDAVLHLTGNRLIDRYDWIYSA
ncbi:MAG: hypothetical protein B7Z45_07305 [Azorhizobium sp. 12-66-6]|nr:MAG: hypothetical protein B7Z45_07305 [Azorhizobium sp. 12-66-6]